MKIVCVDNFNTETKSDTLVADNISKYWGEKLVEFLNEKHSSDNSPNYFRLVEDDYKLFKFEP